MPVQDFGNAFSTFIAQNYGAKEKKRIQQGLKAAVRISAIFVVASTFVYIFSKPLAMIFVERKRNGYYNGRSPLLAHMVHFILESDGCFCCIVLWADRE